jgi:protein CpxP
MPMTSTYRVLAGLAALSAAASVSAASLAQEPPAGPPPAAAREHWAEHARAHAEERAKVLHERLKIRPDQEAAFQAFLASMRPDPGHRAMRHHDGEDAGAALTTPQRLDRMAARMAERQAAFQRRAEAIRGFYATLSADQQHVFDTMPRPMGHGRFGGPEHHGSEGPDGPRG